MRAALNANVNNLLGRGDVLALSAQQNDQAGSALYRIGYTVPVGAQGTRLGLSLARLDYALGKQFQALGASGRADIAGIGVFQPLLRGRGTSLYGFVSAEQKKLVDETRTPALTSAARHRRAQAGPGGQLHRRRGGRQRPEQLRREPHFRPPLRSPRPTRRWTTAWAACAPRAASAS